MTPPGSKIRRVARWPVGESGPILQHPPGRRGRLAAPADPLLSGLATGFFDRLSYHDYEGPSLDLDERERLLANLGENRAMILRNHGLLTTGRTVPEAFLRLYRLERACQIQLDAAAAGSLKIIPDDLARESGKGIDQFAERETNQGMGAIEFAALMRKLDRIDPRVQVEGTEILADSDAVIINIDYPLGMAAYHHLSQLGQGVAEIRGIYVMGKAATLYLLERGVRVTGTDGGSWDAPFVHTKEKFSESGDPGLIWEGHRAGMEIGYCHMEKLANLEQLPATGFEIVCFPVKIKAASAGWCRCVAVLAS